jgi:hypothetical protein
MGMTFRHFARSEVLGYRSGFRVGGISGALIIDRHGGGLSRVGPGPGGGVGLGQPWAFHMLPGHARLKTERKQYQRVRLCLHLSAHQIKTQLRAPGGKRDLVKFWPEVENYIFDLIVEHGPPSPDDPQLPNQMALEELVAVFMQQRGWSAAPGKVRPIIQLARAGNSIS